MTYQEFKEQIYTGVEKRCTPGANMHHFTFTKNNGVELDGLSIYYEGQSISPTLYLNDYYPLVSKGLSIDNIIEKLLEASKRAVNIPNFTPEDIQDFSKVKSAIFFKLINKRANETLLSDVPYVKYLDLAIVFCIMIPMDTKNWGSILIHDNLLETWNITKETLLEYAKINTYQIFAPKVTPLRDLLKEMLTKEDKELFPDLTPAFPMLVVTNCRNNHGASVICYPDYLKNLATEMDTDFIILPSSIHEVILLPLEGSMDIGQLSQMVQQVNATQLSPEEVLSDHAYLYLRHENKVVF